jgi:hypothetical protein
MECLPVSILQLAGVAERRQNREPARKLGVNGKRRGVRRCLELLLILNALLLRAAHDHEGREDQYGKYRDQYQKRQPSGDGGKVFGCR